MACRELRLSVFQLLELDDLAGSARGGVGGVRSRSAIVAARLGANGRAARIFLVDVTE